MISKAPRPAAPRIRWRGIVGTASLAGLVIATFTVVDEARYQLTSPRSLGLAFGLHLVALVCGARAWVALFPPETDRRTLAEGIYTSQLTKYLPAGGFVQTASQVALSSDVSGLRVAALRLPVFSLCFVVASATLGVGLAFDGDLPTWGRLLAGSGILAVLALDRRSLHAVLAAVRRFVRRLPAPEALPGQGAILRCYLFALANMVAFAAAYVVMLRDRADVNPLEAGAALCAGWVIGYLVLVVPGGAGVRELVLVAAIPNLAAGTIIAASVTHRVVGLAAEAAAAGTIHIRRMATRRRRRPQTTAVGAEASGVGDV